MASGAGAGPTIAANRRDILESSLSFSLAGCGKSRELKKTETKQVLYWNCDHVKSMGYSHAAAFEWQRNRDQAIFSGLLD
jgi:hypothetical protein